MTFCFHDSDAMLVHATDHFLLMFKHQLQKGMLHLIGRGVLQQRSTTLLLFAQIKPLV